MTMFAFKLYHIDIIKDNVGIFLLIILVLTASKFRKTIHFDCDSYMDTSARNYCNRGAYFIYFFEWKFQDISYAHRLFFHLPAISHSIH